jgi:hypothetical protein
MRGQNGSGAATADTVELRRVGKPGQHLSLHTEPQIQKQRTGTSRVPRALSPHRHVRLRQPPNEAFRDQLFEAAGFETLLVNLAGGACQTLQAVLDAESDR